MKKMDKGKNSVNDRKKVKMFDDKEGSERDIIIIK